MAPANIFILDDSTTFLETALNYLNLSPFVNSIGWSSSFSDAKIKLKKIKYDLILVDYSMPDINGVTATKMIKAEENPPMVIMLSIHDDIHYKNEAAEAGADGFISKMDFVQQIESLLKKLQKK